ncbi:hypothetical protein ERO13_D07G184901v2, partial [Gossypium hirsutum]
VEQSNVQVAKDPRPIINEVVTANQFKEFIKEAIKDQVDCVTQPSYTYAKPYPYRINSLKMPVRNLHQHVAYFMEIYNNTRIDVDLMVNQFVWSLKGNAFDQYTDLKPRIIDS